MKKKGIGTVARHCQWRVLEIDSKQKIICEVQTWQGNKGKQRRDRDVQERRLLTGEV